jgi:hypothetical protein
MALSAKERRELYKKESEARHKESYAEKDDSGRFKSIYDPTKLLGVKVYKPKEDDHELYIVPYVTGDQHPKLTKGKMAFNVYPFVHRGVGVNEDSYICLNRTYGEKCPICEYQRELRESEEDVDEAIIKALNPTKRAIYNIVCLDSAKEEALGVQLWDVSHYLFTVPLEELAHKKKGGGDVPYANHEIGKIICFRQKGVKRSLEFTAFEFKDRDPLTDEILEATYCLDDLLYVPTYEEVYDAFSSVNEEKPSDDRQETETRQTKEQTESTSAKTLTKKKDEEAEKQMDEATEYKDCPYGAAFGADFNQYEECRTCEARSSCKTKLDEIKAKEEKPTTERKKLTRREK